MSKFFSNITGERIERIILGLLSTGYAQIVTIGLQLASVPILVSNWGAETYGAWIILSTLPAYINLADLGFAQVAANDMTIRFARQDFFGANKTFQTAIAMVLGLSGAILTAATLFAFTVPIVETFHINGVSTLEASWTVFFLTLQILLGILFSLLGSGLRAIGKFPLMISISTTARLVDGLILIGVACQHGTMLNAAVLIVVARICTTVATAIYLFRIAKWLKFGVRLAELKLLREMITPSMSYMSYTLSFAMGIQGVTLITAAMAGPAAVVVVSTVRTLTRTGIMATNMFNHTLEPEYSALYGEKKEHEIGELFRKHIVIVLSISAFYTISMLTFGPIVLKLWTHGSVQAEYIFLVLMAFSVASEMLWSMQQTPFVSTNRHNFFAMFYLFLSFFALPATYFLVQFFGLVGVGWVTFASNLLFLIFTIVRVRALRLI